MNRTSGDNPQTCAGGNFNTGVAFDTRRLSWLSFRNMCRLWIANVGLKKSPSRSSLRSIQMMSCEASVRSFSSNTKDISTNCHWLGLPRTIQSFCQVSGSPVTDKARLGLVSLVFPKSLCKNLGDLWYILRLLKQILQSLNPKPSSPFRWTQKRQLHQQRWQGKAGVWSGVFTVFIPLVFKLFCWRIPSDSLGIQAVKNSITNETAWNRAATMQALGPCEVKAEGHTFGDGWPTCVGISTCHSFTHIKRWASHITIYTKGDTVLHLQSATYTKCCQIRKTYFTKRDAPHCFRTTAPKP